MNLSIGILAWKSGKTLLKTLETYQKNGLLGLTDDIKIYFQEITDEDKALADKFKIPFLGTSENIGIGKAFIALAESAKYENILLLEHDWNLIENATVTKSRLSSGIELLNSGFNVVKYRHRAKPGIPLYSEVHKGKELDYFDDWHQCKSPHLLESVHWLNPATSFPDKIQKQGEYFVTTSRWGNWTNNPCLFKKDFYIEVVKPFTGNTIDLERKMALFWPQQNFKVAHGEGLFTHNDFVKFPPVTTLKKVKTLIKKILKKT